LNCNGKSPKTGNCNGFNPINLNIIGQPIDVHDREMDDLGHVV
jgi:hypothetical protein